MEEKQEMNEKAYEKVFRYIKNGIMNEDYQLGEKLPPERELAARLSVSRNTVREAFRTLGMMGVVESQQGAGNYISGNFEKNLIEFLSMMFMLQRIEYPQISKLRAGLEQKAVELGALNRTEEELEELGAIVKEMRKDDESINAGLDARFHSVLAATSKNKPIIQILQALSSVTESFISDMHSDIMVSAEAKKQLQEAHEQVVQALEEHDSEKAEQAIKFHFETVDEQLALR
ncbi:FadR family transcriptional regulator [Ruminococcus sp. OA3]|uniref:FadR/GntR family transcriptional regulator n=1 Tax=Ruminococcus sp. OA3 TaxID=2914164 RepID=UPI001F06F8FD|nr:FadR/GntR family transcriptional regulator [Ruminococcus sp. OA3]MCH1981674.1 FadR family transcriptional regulator [Ruminococcus sp. OA3]